MTETLERFRSEYQTYHGLSPQREREQQKELAEFASWAGKETPQDCDDDDLRRYLAFLIERGLKPTSVRTRHHMLRPFYTWAFETRLLDAESLMRINLVKSPKGSGGNGVPKPYSAKELSAFWDDLSARFPLDERFPYWLGRYDRSASRWRRLADHVERVQAEAIFSLMLEGGLRKIEVFTASIDHVHPDNRTLVIPQRGERASGKDHFREIPATNALRDSMHRWLELRAQLGVSHDSLWIAATKSEVLTRVGNPMTFKSFTALPGRIGPYRYHRFRHTCATLWLRSGMKLEKVQKMLGHATLEQTLAYAELVNEDIADAAEENEAKFQQLTRRQR